MTDSNSGIMPAAGKEAGIHVIPMPILIDEKTYYEGQDITPEEFYKKAFSGSFGNHFPAISRHYHRGLESTSQIP